MNRQVTIASAQYPITEFRSPEAWKTHLSDRVNAAKQKGAELLVFPEYAAMELVSLFQPEILHDLHRQLDALQEVLSDYRMVHAELAKQHNCTIVAGSFPVKENGMYKNRVYVYSPVGEIGFQDKRFMTRFEHESWGITGEKTALKLFRASWGSFGIQTCYDIEFPHGSAELCRNGAGIILAPSCTETLRGATRVHIGARARALENQCYTVVAQTVGNAAWSPAVDINYGYAGFYATPDLDFPETGILLEGRHQEETWEIMTLDLAKIDMVRKEGQVFNFRDQLAAADDKKQNVTVYDL